MILFPATLIQYPPLAIVITFSLCSDAKVELTKECEAPKSKSTTAGWSLTKKLISGDHFTSRNFLYRSIVNTPLSDVSLRILLARIRTIISPVTRLVAILARPVRWWDIRIALPRSILRQENCVSLAKTSFSLILLLRWAVPDISSRGMILGFGHHWRLRLRSTYLKISFTGLGSSIYLIIVLLS
jgi:predicted membrane protein